MQAKNKTSKFCVPCRFAQWFPHCSSQEYIQFLHIHHLLSQPRIANFPYHYMTLFVVHYAQAVLVYPCLLILAHNWNSYCVTAKETRTVINCGMSNYIIKKFTHWVYSTQPIQNIVISQRMSCSSSITLQSQNIIDIHICYISNNTLCNQHTN